MTTIKKPMVTLQSSQEVFPHAGEKGNWADEMDLLDLPPMNISASSSDLQANNTQGDCTDNVPEDKLEIVWT